MSVDVCTKNNISGIASANISVVAAAYLIAETGTAVLVSSPDQPRTLALLPETVFILAETPQLLLDMESVISHLKTHKAFTGASSITFVTGPSRTADIEKTLVRGVHGPKRLIVISVAA